MRNRTLDEIAYDIYVTVGRGHGETYLFEVGYWLGLLELYLDESFIVDQEYEARQSDWYYEPVFAEARDEGRDARVEHTAEDLFLWAHDWMAERTHPLD